MIVAFNEQFSEYSIGVFNCEIKKIEKNQLIIKLSNDIRSRHFILEYTIPPIHAIANQI